MELIQAKPPILWMLEQWLREAETLARACPVSHWQSWGPTWLPQLLVLYFLQHTRWLLLAL